MIHIELDRIIGRNKTSKNVTLTYSILLEFTRRGTSTSYHHYINFSLLLFYQYRTQTFVTLEKIHMIKSVL